MPIITTLTLPNGGLGSVYSTPIVADRDNLHIEISNVAVLPDGSGVDDQGDVSWNATLIITYTLINVGDDDVNIGLVSPTVITPASGVTATVSSTPAALVEPSGVTTFEITVTLSTGLPFEIAVAVSSDADVPEDNYTFSIVGVGVDQLFNNPELEINKWCPESASFDVPSVQDKRDQAIDFGVPAVATSYNIDTLVSNAEWAIDLGRGTTAVYQTADTTTPAAADGDPIYSIYPEKTPTGSNAIKLLDSNATTHGTYKDAAGYAIGGSPVISLVNGTDGLYYPVNSSDVQQTDNSNYISTSKWWCAFLLRIRPGTDNTYRSVLRADGVPRVYVEFKQQEIAYTTDVYIRLFVDATPADAHVIANELRDGTNGNIVFGAAYWDGTNYHFWNNTTTRTSQTPPSTPATLESLNSTSPKIIGLDGAYPIDVQAWYQGDQDDGNPSEHIANLQGLINDFASR